MWIDLFEYPKGFIISCACSFTVFDLCRFSLHADQVSLHFRKVENIALRVKEEDGRVGYDFCADCR